MQLYSSVIPSLYTHIHYIFIYSIILYHLIIYIYETANSAEARSSTRKLLRVSSLLLLLPGLLRRLTVLRALGLPFSRSGGAGRGHSSKPPKSCQRWQQRQAGRCGPRKPFSRPCSISLEARGFPAPRGACLAPFRVQFPYRNAVSRDVSAKVSRRDRSEAPSKPHRLHSTPSHQILGFKSS